MAALYIKHHEVVLGPTNIHCFNQFPKVNVRYEIPNITWKETAHFGKW